MDLEGFLSPVLNELNELQGGFLFANRLFEVSLKCIIADSPAKSMLKCVQSHNGYNGCDKCFVVGEHFNHRMIFCDIDSELRTEENFHTDLSNNHRKETSPIASTGFPMVSALDYMHLVCLGVVKRLLKMWVEGPIPFKLCHRQIVQLDHSMSICCYMSS